MHKCRIFLISEKRSRLYWPSDRKMELKWPCKDSRHLTNALLRTQKKYLLPSLRNNYKLLKLWAGVSSEKRLINYSAHTIGFGFPWKLRSKCLKVIIFIPFKIARFAVKERFWRFSTIKNLRTKYGSGLYMVDVIQQAIFHLMGEWRDFLVPSLLLVSDWGQSAAWCRV